VCSTPCGIRVLPALGEAVIFLSLTNMRGEYAVDVAWLRGDTEAELACVSVDPVTVEDPLARLSVEIDAEDLPLPVAGRYVLRLRVNGRHVHDSVIMVHGDRE
jgi:hypothetical protein